MHKFKVGDRVVGNKTASEEYSITVEGWEGVVLGLVSKDVIEVEGKGRRGLDKFRVFSKCFDLVAPFSLENE